MAEQGKQSTGLTKDVGYQIGVRRTLFQAALHGLEELV